MKRLTCTVASDVGELEPLRAAWSDLLARSASDEPTLTPAWVLAWWRVFGPEDGRALRVALFRDEDGVLVGMAPLLLRVHWHRPAIPFRRLEPLGSGEREADETCSDYLNVIAARGAEERVAARFAEALAGGELGGWDELVLPGMDGSGAMPSLLARALGRAGVEASLTPAGVSHYIALPGAFPAYLAQLSASGRYLVSRSLRDFEAWAKGEVKLEVVSEAGQIGAGLRVLRSLHGERWSAAGSGGAFTSARFSAFHEAVMPALFAAGELDLLWLSVRGEPVAAMYNIVHRDKVYFYQCGRKLEVPKGVRPGIVMHAEGIRRSIALGRAEYDFLRGAQQYKKQLGTAERPIVELRALGTGRASLVREQARALAQAGMALARRARVALAESAPEPLLRYVGRASVIGHKS